MPDIKKLQAEAEAKGLHGEAEQRYVGGVFNRIRQAHARATQPGKGAVHLNRKRRESMQELTRRANMETMARLEDQARALYASGESQAQLRLSYLEHTAIPIGERHAKEGSALAKRNLRLDKAEATKLRKRIADRMRELGLAEP